MKRLLQLYCATKGAQLTATSVILRSKLHVQSIFFPQKKHLCQEGLFTAERELMGFGYRLYSNHISGLGILCQAGKMFLDIWCRLSFVSMGNPFLPKSISLQISVRIFHMPHDRESTCHGLSILTPHNKTNVTPFMVKERLNQGNKINSGGEKTISFVGINMKQNWLTPRN